MKKKTKLMFASDLDVVSSAELMGIDRDFSLEIKEVAVVAALSA